MIKSTNGLALSIAFAYFLFGLLLLFLSDQIVRGMSLNASAVPTLLRYKEWVFIGISSVGLYLLLRIGYRRLAVFAPRKAVEQALRESEQRFRDLVETTSDWVWEIDAEGRYTYASPRCKDLLGYEPDEIIGKTPFDLLPPEEAKTIGEAFRAMVSARANIDKLENRNRHRDGREVILETSGVAIIDAAGALAGYRGIDRDITDRKHSEDALRESAEKFRLLVENQTDLVVKVDRDGKFEFVSPSYCKVFDKTEEELLGKRFMPLVHEDDRDQTAKAMEDLFRPPYQAYLEQRAMTRDGWRWLGWMDTAVRDDAGNVTAIIGVGRDIADRREAERELVEKEARYRQVVEHMSDGVAVYEAVDDGADFVFVEHNRAGERISGLSRDEVIGKPVAQVFPGVVSIGLLETFRRVWLSGQPESHPVSEYQDDRVILWVENHVFKLPSGQVVAVYADATARKRASEELEKRVSERTAELTAANQELESFTYSVSHDLRAPLRAIRGFSQALLEDYGAELPAGAKDYLSEIESGGARMGELIDGLLTLSRSTRGGVAREPVNISDIAVAALRRLAQQEPGRNVNVRVEAGLKANADLRLVKTLLNNLLENAWKYTGDKDNTEIAVFGDARNDEAVFCVRDNGAGFDRAFAGKLFEPFQRLHRQDEFPGIGIGLATVQRIVRRHGGWIIGDGTPGEGAEFCFTLAEASTPST